MFGTIGTHLPPQIPELEKRHLPGILGLSLTCLCSLSRRRNGCQWSALPTEHEPVVTWGRNLGRGCERQPKKGLMGRGLPYPGKNSAGMSFSLGTWRGGLWDVLVANSLVLLENGCEPWLPIASCPLKYNTEPGIIFYSSVVGLEPKASTMQGKHFTLSHTCLEFRIAKSLRFLLWWVPKSPVSSEKEKSEVRGHAHLLRDEVLSLLARTIHLFGRCFL